MEITAALVKDLRERTGSGMMECKKALVEAQGDIELAVDIMRKAGLAKADKKSSRIATEGAILARVAANGRNAVLVEINCETDFVAKGDDFAVFANLVADHALQARTTDVETLLALPVDAQGASLNTTRLAVVAKIGENISVRRLVSMESATGHFGVYLHGTRIGVLVELSGGDATLAKDVAMHVAAAKPVCVAPEDVPTELVEKEKEIFRAQAQESGKPANIIEKMIQGRVQKFLNEVALTGQPFVKNPEITVEKLLQQAGAKVLRFARLEVGEGIEKKADNFVEEVMAQVRGG